MYVCAYVLSHQIAVLRYISLVNGNAATRIRQIQQQQQQRRQIYENFVLFNWQQVISSTVLPFIVWLFPPLNIVSYRCRRAGICKYVSDENNIFSAALLRRLSCHMHTHTDTRRHSFIYEVRSPWTSLSFYTLFVKWIYITDANDVVADGKQRAWWCWTIVMMVVVAMMAVRTEESLEWIAAASIFVISFIRVCVCCVHIFVHIVFFSFLLLYNTVARYSLINFLSNGVDIDRTMHKAHTREWIHDQFKRAHKYFVLDGNGRRHLSALFKHFMFCCRLDYSILHLNGKNEKRKIVWLSVATECVCALCVESEINVVIQLPIGLGFIHNSYTKNEATQLRCRS